MKSLEELYLIKNAGSSGDVYDMSRIKLVTMNEIMQFIEDCGADKHTLQLKHIGYDKRIGFEIWYALADYKEYKQQCMMFIYSNSKSTPYINTKEEKK